MKRQKKIDCMLIAILLVLAGTSTHALAQAREPILSLAKKEKPALLETLKQLVSIETGSRDFEGLGKLANLIAARLKDLGGQVELVDPSDVYKMEDTPEKIGQMVRATFKGTGARKILMIAHMDTVYPRGMLAQQPFRIDGDRAYGLGIADDKQGIAVILHALAMLKAMTFSDYGTLTVLINADEELSSPGSRSLITQAWRRARRRRFRSNPHALNPTNFRWRPAASPRLHSPLRAAHRIPATRRNAALTRSTSSRTRCCRPAIFPILP